MSEWQTIDTAPHDQVIMLYAKEGNQAEHGQRIGVGKFAYNWTGNDDRIERHYFELYEYVNHDGKIVSRMMSASHWMPLPEPPKASKPEQEWD